MKIRIAGVVNDSIVDGPGIRYTVFFQGCTHNCLNCHNPQTHDVNGGYLIDADEIIEKLKNNPLLDGITLSGGDPLLQIEGVIIERDSVSRIEIGTRFVADYEIVALCKVLNVTPAYLLGIG